MRSRHSDEPFEAPIRLPSQTPFATQGDYKAFCAWFSFLMNYSEPRSKFPGGTAEFWLGTVPQIAYNSDALRFAMMASGTTAISLVRKEVGSAALQSRRVTLSHANKAIRAMTAQTASASILEMVLTAWMFWHADTMNGDTQSATMHMRSALKLSRCAGTGLQSDQIAKSFLKRWPSTWSPLEDEIDGWLPLSEEDLVEVQDCKTVTILIQGYSELRTCSRRVQASNIPTKTRILAVLDESKQEVQWCLMKWLSCDEYVKWRATADESDQCENFRFRGMYSRVVQIVDGYLAGSEEFPVEQWEGWVSGTPLMLFLSSIKSDLKLRHDMLDYMEFARQVRVLRRPTPGDWLPLPFYCGTV